MTLQIHIVTKPELINSKVTGISRRPGFERCAMLSARNGSIDLFPMRYANSQGIPNPAIRAGEKKTPRASALIT